MCSRVSQKTYFPRLIAGVLKTPNEALLLCVRPPHTFLGMLWLQELFGACGNIRDGAAKVGLNMLTKALAKSVMDDDGQKYRLDFMRAIYVVDGEGTLWFSHATDVRVWSSQKPVEDDGANPVLPACQLVKSELKRVLGQAISTGASIEELFAHFDPFKRG